MYCEKWLLKSLLRQNWVSRFLGMCPKAQLLVFSEEKTVARPNHLPCVLIQQPAGHFLFVFL